MRTDWFATQLHGNPTPVDTTPPKRAVLLYNGKPRVFPGVLEAIEYARRNWQIGAKVFAGGKLCATIEPFDSSHLFRLNGAIPTGYPMTDNFGVLSYAVA